MDTLFTIPTQELMAAWEFIKNYATSLPALAQLAWLLASLLLGHLASRPLAKRVRRINRRMPNKWITEALSALQSVTMPIVSFILMSLYMPVAGLIEYPIDLARLFANLLGAWIIIRFASSFITHKGFARLITWVIFTIAALNTFGILTPLLHQLDAIGFNIGDGKRLSILTALKGMITLVVVLWGANLLSRITERKLNNSTNLTPSLRVLFAKAVRIALITFAVLIGLNTLGIDLTSLAVLSGAIGVGLGFGLQKVVSNFISGIILLLDRSIKPGDVIAIEETYGWVNKLSARHVSVITRDGKEHLIPNELLITEKVENWSFSDKNIRLKIPVGISYNNDPREALRLMLEAADITERVLKYPKPNALMIGFGDSSIDLELRCWIDDPSNGIRNVTSHILLNIWDKFKDNGVEIPFPQRDVHIVSDVAKKNKPL